jgi:hypothetical protein
VEEVEPVTLEYNGVHKEVNIKLQENETPQIKETCSIGKGTSPGSPIPPTLSTSLVTSLFHSSTTSIFHSSLSFPSSTSLLGSNNVSVVSSTIISQP